MQTQLHQRCARGARQSAPNTHRAAVRCRVFTNWPKKADDESNPGPPDAPKSTLTREIIAEGREWLETILSRFGPVKERAQQVTTLDFEKPLLELDKRIKEVGRFRPCSSLSTR